MSDTDTDTEAFVDDSPAEDIDKAKSIGWKDPSDWKGNPPKNGFVKASEYLKRAETVIPIMRSHNTKLESELSEARAELKSFKDTTAKTIERMSSMTKVALDRQRTQLEDKYSAAIDAATEVGDKDQVRKLRDAERKDLKAFDEAADESRPDPKELEKATEKVNAALPKDVQDTIGEWIAVNPWYTTDAAMQALANAHHGKLLKEKPGMTLADNLEETRKYVAKKFPEEFGVANEPDDDDPPARGSRVEGGSRVAGGGARSKFSQLPADAKTQADKFIKDDGLFLEKGETAEKDLAKARERYAAAYLES
jgi:hypothetical protein